MNTTTTRNLLISCILLLCTITPIHSFGDALFYNVTDSFGEYSSTSRQSLAYDAINDKYLLTWMISGEFFATPVYQGRFYASNGTILQDTFSLNVSKVYTPSLPGLVGNGEGSYLYYYIAPSRDDYITRVQGIILGSDGSTVKTVFQISPESNEYASWPSATYNKDTKKYLVVWVSRDTSISDFKYGVFGASIDSVDGTVSSQFRVSSSTTSFSVASNVAPKIAYNPIVKNFFVAWQYDPSTGLENYVAGRNIDDNGEGTSIELDFGQGTSRPNVIAHESKSEYLVLRKGSNTITAQRVSALGANIGSSVDIVTDVTTGNPFGAYSASEGYLIAYGVAGVSYTLAKVDDSSLSVTESFEFFNGTRSVGDIIIRTDTSNILAFMPRSDAQYTNYLAGVSIIPVVPTVAPTEAPTQAPTLPPTTLPPTTLPPTTEPPTTILATTEAPTTQPTTTAPTTAEAVASPTGLSSVILALIIVGVIILIIIIAAIVVTAYFCRPKPGDQEIVVNVNTPAAYEPAEPQEIPVGVPIGQPLPNPEFHPQEIPLQFAPH
mmetsp:Transcript_6661/g.7254  ORF Transcript_6661/g.7254 Transcript_6661/m.7254 type:complete len:549 (+) Transcript_6661:29-1675(+)